MNDIWKPASGLENYYEVSNLGKIRSIKRKIKNWPSGTRTVGGRVLKCCINSSGYKVFALPKKKLVNGKVKHVFLHRYVASTFIPNTENKPYINHIDGDKQNNNIDNLEWCTHQENMSHAMRSGLNSCRKSVIGYKNNKIGYWFPSQADGSRFAEISKPNVCRVLNGVRNKTKGWFWEYA